MITHRPSLLEVWTQVCTLSCVAWTPGRRVCCGFELSLGAGRARNARLLGSCFCQRTMSLCLALLTCSRGHQQCGRESSVGPAWKTGPLSAPASSSLTTWRRAVSLTEGLAGGGGLPHWDIMTPRGLQASGATLPSDAEPLLCATLNKHSVHI